MQVHFLRAVPIWLSVASFAIRSQAGPEVELSADLLTLFKPDRAHDALSCEVRRPATADGEKEDALFEHPLAPGRPARVDYDLDLPPASETAPLLLAFDIALSDGIKPGKGEDGVRFSVQVDGRDLFARETIETRWQPQVVDLSSFAGRRVRLTLLTDALRNTSYDWALWGRPRVIKFRDARPGGSETNPARPIKLTGPVGAVAVNTILPFSLRVIPDSGEPPVILANWSSNATAKWFVRDFNFPRADEVTVEWEPAQALRPSDVRVGAYQPSLKLTRVSAARAIVETGDSVPIHVEVANDGPGILPPSEGQVRLRIGQRILPAQSLPKLQPAQSWETEWTWRAPDRAGTVDVEVELTPAQATGRMTSRIEVQAHAIASRNAVVENEMLRLEFVRQPDGFAYANVLTRQSGAWTPVAVWSPLFRVVNETRSGGANRQIRPRKARFQNALKDSVEFIQTARDADGVDWEAQLRVSLETNRPLARIHYEWKAARPRRVRELLGPNLYLGDGTSGTAKTWGLFPGLEYLFGAEPSSNPRDFAPNLADRRTPDPHKITVPLMAVTIGPESESRPEWTDRYFTPDSLMDQARRPTTQANSDRANPAAETTVGLWWNPLQRWDGQRAFPSARFASANFDEGMANHRLGLFLPSTPEFASENAERANPPYELAAKQSLTLDATLVVATGAVNVAVREFVRDIGGLPNPNPWPRPFQSELDVCREGFLKTVWDDKSQRWSHCIGWAASHAPGFAALLWLDSHLAEQPDARRRSRERVTRVVEDMLRDSGPGLFTSQANCHILQWEFPFLYGYLPEAVSGLESQIRQLIQTQRADGGWVYEPANAQQSDLGRAGDSVLGTCANRAATLLRYARITADAAALAAGEKALRFMEQFRVPRGGQTWECPMYEPDILAAAYAVRAYHDGYRATANPRWLHDAVYWAETGVPFIYLWSLPDKPMMLGSTIPVFGSTFYTHTWLGVPVQWCGLVYAYHVFHLARDLERTPLPKTDSSLPLALNFSAADWRRIVELITVSATHQQFADGDRIGAYPDSISQFERRNPAFINPEDILVNVLALEGHDPDVKTATLRRATGDIVVSSGAKIEQLRETGQGIRFELSFFPGEPSHTLVTGLTPQDVRVDGRPLPRSAAPVRREPGWWWDDPRARLYLVVPSGKKAAQVDVAASNTERPRR